MCIRDRIYGLDDLVIRRRMIEENSSEDKFKFHENKRLDYLLSYCETPECRRKVLLSYFDEESEDAWKISKTQVYVACLVLGGGIYLLNHGVIQFIWSAISSLF